jgi:flagellar biosynthesis chaperone FliJ
VRYTWKEDGRDDIGLIAEEVGEVVPEVVTYEENGVDARTVNYGRLVGVLVESIKQQQRNIQQQRQEVDALRARVNRLERLVEQQARAAAGDSSTASSPQE